MKKILLPVILLSAFTAGAQVSIVGSGVPVSEDFTGFDGTGFDPAPAAGQLNSNNREVLDFQMETCCLRFICHRRSGSWNHHW